MLKRLLGILLLLTGLGVMAYFFKDILAFSQATIVQREAQEAVKIRNWEKAIDIYEQGVRDNPDNLEIALQLARLYARTARPDKAIALYENILNVQPASLDARIGLAKMLESDPKRWNNAVEQYRKALGYLPEKGAKRARLLSQMGGLYKTAFENQDETRDSVKNWLSHWAVYYYVLALKENPNHFGSQFDLGVLYQNKRDTQKAATHYCNALLLKPNSYEARFNLGLLLVDLDYLDAAYQQFERSVKILTGSDRIPEAQQLAQRVQNVKNSVYNNTRKRGLTSSRPLPDYISDTCLHGEEETANQAAKKSE